MKKEIELKRKTYEELQQTVTELVLEKRKLEKALDKACETIEFLTSDSDKPMSKEQYKAVLMNADD